MIVTAPVNRNGSGYERGFDDFCLRAESASENVSILVSPYDRRGLWYPRGLTDGEGTVLASLLPRAKRSGNKRIADEQRNG